MHSCRRVVQGLRRCSQTPVTPFAGATVSQLRTADGACLELSRPDVNGTVLTMPCNRTTVLQHWRPWQLENGWDGVDDNSSYQARGTVGRCTSLHPSQLAEADSTRPSPWGCRPTDPLPWPTFACGRWLLLRLPGPDLCLSTAGTAGAPMGGICITSDCSSVGPMLGIAPCDAADTDQWVRWLDIVTLGEPMSLRSLLKWLGRHVSGRAGRSHTRFAHLLVELGLSRLVIVVSVVSRFARPLSSANHCHEDTPP
jgi:hypothetical protein